jgi:hypothetical protein
MRLIFIDDRAQAAAAAADAELAGALPVAMTAQAVQAMEEFKIPHRFVGEFSSTKPVSASQRLLDHRLWTLALEIDGYLERAYPRYRTHTPGLFSQLVYYLDHLATGTLARAHLMDATISALKPDQCLLRLGPVYPFYAENGHAAHPWTSLLGQIEARRSTQFVTLPPPGDEAYAEARVFPDDEPLRPLLKLRVPAPPELDIPGLDKARLLFPVTDGYDWRPVLDAMLPKGTKAWLLPREHTGIENVWRNTFLPRLEDLTTGEVITLPEPFPQGLDADCSPLFERWLETRPEPPEVEALGFNLFESLLPDLRAMAARSPYVAFHSRELAAAALNAAGANAACLFSIATPCTRALNAVCASRGVPTVIYQHGGGLPDDYTRPQVDAKMSGASYQITYGPAWKPNNRSPYGGSIPFIPIGSARMAQLASKQLLEPIPASEKLRVLWVSEFNFGNTRAQAYSLEDTSRYRLEREALGLLDKSGKLVVTFRPYPGFQRVDGTSRMLAIGGMRHVSLNIRQPFPELLRMADLVVSVNHSHTIWLEALALGKPGLMYFDPEVYPGSISTSTANLLEKTFLWKRDEESFLEAVKSLAAGGRDFMENMPLRDPSLFLCQSVFGGEPETIVHRVASFLIDICVSNPRHGQWPAPGQRQETSGETA